RVHGEGAFYVWKADEIERPLGPDAAAILEFRYGAKAGGNVPAEQDIEGWLKGKNVLYAEHSPAKTAAKLGKTTADIEKILGEAREKLLAARGLRPRPPVDTKIITSWNGLMISALARASQALDEPKYLEAANRAAAVVLAKLYVPATGKLKRRLSQGNVSGDGYLDDYSFL